MAQAETMRRVNIRNDKNCELGDNVKFLLPDMIDMFSSIRGNFLAIIIAIIIGSLASPFVKDLFPGYGSLAVLGIMAAVFIFLKLILGKLNRSSMDKLRHEIVILEVYGKGCPL